MSARDSNIEGGAALDALLKTLPAKIEKNIMRNALREGAKVYLDEIKEKIPADSGQLRKSARITTRSGRGGVSASVKVGNFVAWYAHLIEFGTQPHKIKAAAGSALEVSGHPFADVDHPGIQKKPFMRPAADTKFDDAVAAVTARIRQRLTENGINTPDPTPPENEP